MSVMEEGDKGVGQIPQDDGGREVGVVEDENGCWQDLYAVATLRKVKAISVVQAGQSGSARHPCHTCKLVPFVDRKSVV